MLPLTDLHAGLARALVLYLTVLGVWGLLAWRRGTGVSPSYRGALVIAWVTVVLQGVLGFGVWLAAGTGPRESLHVLYGFALAVALPVGYLYVRDRVPRQQSLALALLTLFAAGLAIRGITTS
jgi:hypothetical protein